MKRNIGVIAAVVAGICFFLWILVVFLGLGLDSEYPIFPMLVFITFAASGITAMYCLGSIGSRKTYGGDFFTANTTDVPKKTKFCTQCGKQVEETTKFCPDCGNQFN